jgi:ribose transport system ATP-binding protein
VGLRQRQRAPSSRLALAIGASTYFLPAGALQHRSWHRSPSMSATLAADHLLERSSVAAPGRVVASATPTLTAPRDISVVGVRKAFGPTRALDNVNFSASRGEVHAIVGGNGCGKSTLAKVISGVLPPDGGQVSVFGHTPASPHESRAAGIATVFQEILVADESSIVDNLFLGADRLFSKSMSMREKEHHAEILLRDLTGLSIDVRSQVGGLPLGLKQWIVIGRALLAEPRALILDESSAALDLDATQRLFAKLEEMRAAGCAILIVTHRIAELVQIADRATVLRDGRDVGVLERRDITERNLLSLMTGKTASAMTARSPAEPAQKGELLLDVTGVRVWPRAASVRFQLHRGEIVGIAGLDGQGQAEFIRVLAGIDRCAVGVPKGRSTDGDLVPVGSLADAAACSIAYVSGDRKREGIFPNLSIYENMLLPRYRRSSHAGWLRILDAAALSSAFEYERERLSVRMGDQDDRITSLSGGNQQKILIGRAFALNPDVLLLNDPARGVDVGAKADLYTYLHDFAASHRAVVYLSSEIEELPGLCHRVLVFRNGSVFEELPEPAIRPELILRAMFGQSTRHGDFEPRPLEPSDESMDQEADALVAARQFTLVSVAFADGEAIPETYVEASKTSPPLAWSTPPAGTRSFALAVTDPDLPEAFNFPRAFAHWLVHDIPADVRGLPEGASHGDIVGMPTGAKQLNSDFVTFGIPGFGRGWGGPWPPDRMHRYVFTLYALKVDRLDLPFDSDLTAFAAAVLPVTISAATLVGHYGPAKKPLPTA